MLIKTNELTGAALNWAVATALGWVLVERHGWWGWWTRKANGEKRYCQTQVSSWNPTSDLAEGTSILFKAGISLLYQAGDGWDAYKLMTPGKKFRDLSPLVAGLRCFVAAELGDEVDIPVEFLGDKPRLR